MCGQHNARASAEDNRGQNTDKGHTPNPRTEIKIPDHAGNGTRTAGLEGRDSTDHATATDSIKFNKQNLRSLSRPRWSRGYHTRHWKRGSRVQTRPGSVIFKKRKNPEYDSFARKVKPWVPSRIFTTRKRTSSGN